MKASKLLLLLMIPVVIVTFLHYLITGFVIYSDGIGYFAYTHSLIIDGDVNFSNEAEHYQSESSRFSGVARGAALTPLITDIGKLGNQYLVGNGLLWSPFFLTAHALTGFQGDGYGTIYEFSVFVASLVYGFLALLLLYKFCRIWFSHRTSLISVVLMWYGTGIFWYHTVNPSMAHINSLLLTTLFVYFWYKTLNKRTITQWFILGLLLGFVYLVRQTDVVVALVLLYDVKGLKAKHAAVAVAGLFFSLLPQLFIWKNLYGSWIVYSFKGVSGAAVVFPQLIPVLFSMSGIWRMPVLVLSFIGLSCFVKRVKGVSLYFILPVVSLSLFTMSWPGWSSDYGFRFLIGLTPFLVLGLAELISKVRLSKVYLVVAGLILFNFVNMIMFLLEEVSVKVPVNEIVKKLFGG